MSTGTNVKIHLLAGALLACACWALDQFAGVKIPAEIAMAGGTIVETILLLVLPADVLDKAGQ